MKGMEFIEGVRALLGGEIDREEFIIGAQPRLYADYRGYGVKVDILIEGELLFVVCTPPPHQLRVRHEGTVSRALHHIGLTGHRTTGDSAFDDRYVLDFVSQEEVASLLSYEVRSLIVRLEPFVQIEFTHKEYRCLKAFKSFGDYRPAQVVSDLEALLRIVQLTSTLPGMHAGA